VAVNAYGVIGSIDEPHLSPIWRAMMNARSDEYVEAGLVVTPAATPYTVNISYGQGIQAGVYTIAASPGPYTATTGPKSSADRIDRIVLQIDWAAARTAYNNTSLTTEAARSAAARAAAPSFIAVPGVAGTTPSPPGLVRTAGTKWQMSLARVLVRANLTTGQPFLTSDITPEHPYQPEKVCSGVATLNPAGTASPYTDLVTVQLPLGFFASNGYRVTFGEGTGTSVSHTKHIWWGNKTTTSFTIGINSDTNTATTVEWHASGY
jgi:hypothetical protein